MSRSPSVLFAVAVAATIVLVSASPAAAHDELISSTPASGSQLSEAPAEISLTFSADVLTIGAAVIVADGAGRDWAVGEPTVQSGTVTVELGAGMPEGGYQIRWRVVSEDGHPISGLVPFTVGEAAPLTRTPAATDTPESASTDPAVAMQDQSTQEDQGVLRILLVGAGGALAATAVYALIHLIRRKKGTSS